MNKLKPKITTNKIMIGTRTAAAIMSPLLVLVTIAACYYTISISLMSIFSKEFEIAILDVPINLQRFPSTVTVLVLAVALTLKVQYLVDIVFSRKLLRLITTKQ